jgi:hypothetical protein
LIREFPEYKRLDYRGYSEGYIAIVSEEGGSTMDHNFNLLIPFGIYDCVRFFSEDRAIVCLRTDNKETKSYADLDYGAINKKGELIIPIEFDELSDFSDGTAVMREGTFEEGLHGFINKDGEIIIEAKYKAVTRWGPDALGRMIGFQYGLCAVLADNNKWGYINRRDEWVIEPIFEDAAPFFGGYAIVEYNGSIYFLSVEKIREDYNLEL